MAALVLVELPGDLGELGGALVEVPLPCVELLLEPAVVLFDERQLLLALGEALAGGLVFLLQAIEPIVALLIALVELAAQVEHFLARAGHLLLMALPVGFLLLDQLLTAAQVRVPLAALRFPLPIRLGLLRVALGKDALEGSFSCWKRTTWPRNCVMACWSCTRP